MGDKKSRAREADKEYWSHVDVVFKAEKGIPKICACGKPMREMIDEEDSCDYLPGKRYFICTDYAQDGMHFRQPWVMGIQQEVERMKKMVSDNEHCIRKCLGMITSLLGRVSELEKSYHSSKSNSPNLCPVMDMRDDRGIGL